MTEVADPHAAAFDEAVAEVLGKNAPAKATSPAAQGDNRYQAAFDEATKEVLGSRAAAPVEASTQTASNPAEGRSFLGEIGRQIGLTARAGINSVAALPAMAADAVTGPINAGLDKVQGEGKGYRFRKQSDVLNELLTKAGLPVPENATERVVQDAASAMAGTGGAIGAAKVLEKTGGAVASQVGKALSAGAGNQVVGAATGAGASGITRENGGSEGAQLAAGLLGSVGPSVGLAAGRGALRGAIRGGEEGRQKLVENLRVFEEGGGTTPSMGQATESRGARAVESLLSKTPGGAGPMSKFAENQATKMQASVQRLADDIAPNANAVSAGEAITRGVNKFKSDFKAQQGQLYAALDKEIPAGTRVSADRTQQALAALNEDIAGAPELSKWFKNARIAGIEGGLKSDAQGAEAVLTRPGMAEKVQQMRDSLEQQAAKIEAMNAERQSLKLPNLDPVPTAADIDAKINGYLQSQVDDRLPYESVKKLRTLVGRELEGNSLVADVPRSKWQALYGALSEDLGDAAKQAGPKAEAAWTTANDFTRTGLQKLDELSTVVGRDTPEAMFQYATNGSQEGGTKIGRVMAALPLDERKQVAAAVIQRMGRALPGKQDDLGNAFSSSTFLSNFAKLSDDAQTALFNNLGNAKIPERLKLLKQMANNIREGSQVFANPSGTAAALTGMDTAKAAGVALLTGNPGTAAAIAGVPVGANIAARAMTSPGLLRAAAEPVTLTAGTVPAGIEALGRGTYDSAPQPEQNHYEAGMKELAAATTVDGAIAGAARAMAGGPKIDQRLVPLSRRQPAPDTVQPVRDQRLIPLSQRAAEPLSRSTAPVNEGGVAPAVVWFGRHGPGYPTGDMAVQALNARRRAMPDLKWQVEPLKNGRFRLAGYE